jgi:mono/diheme cytochrome c family protein
MWATNFKIVMVVLGTVTLFTLVSMWIPQVESEVPEELAFTGEVTAEDLVRAGEQLYHGAGGCVACHGLGVRAPRLLDDDRGAGLIGERCDERVPGMSCKDYLWESMVEPGAYVVAGYQDIMPDARRTLSDAQIWSIVAFLQSVGGEVTVDASDIDLGEAPAPTSPGTAAGAGTSPATPEASRDPVTMLQQHACLACHEVGGEGGTIGPPLDGLGERRSLAQIRRAILDPQADTVPGYEAVAGTMPTDYGEKLTAGQLEALVRFLAGEEGP